MKFYGIGDDETARGLRLAGVEAGVVSDARGTAEALRLAAGRKDCGVIIITAAAAALARAQVDEIKLERAGPLIVEI